MYECITVCVAIATGSVSYSHYTLCTSTQLCVLEAVHTAHLEELNVAEVKDGGKDAEQAVEERGQWVKVGVRGG